MHATIQEKLSAAEGNEWEVERWTTLAFVHLDRLTRKEVARRMDIDERTVSRRADEGYELLWGELSRILWPRDPL